MRLNELRGEELELRKARIQQLKGMEKDIEKIDFNITGTKISLGNWQFPAWTSFLLTSSLIVLLFCYIAFGETSISVCSVKIPSIMENFCVGWRLLYVLTFSIILLPLTFLVGIVEFFQHIKGKKSAFKELSDQLRFQADFNIVSKTLIYSAFILAVQILVHFDAFNLLPDLLRFPFLVFDTDAMLPIALALLFIAVRQRYIFSSISSKLLYLVIFLNISSVVFSRGVRLVWEVGVNRFF